MRAVRHTPEGIRPVEVPIPATVAVVGPGITGFGLLGGAAALLAYRPEIAEAMITQRFPLDGAGEAFALAASDTPTLKVVVEP